jgi:Protein of unknown function (DUF3667)
MSHKKYRKETNCLNCGAEVTGKFCSSCGQENIETHENFFHLVFHVIGDFFHFDSKFFRSFIPLFTKPGFLTAEYWAGRRQHYIHPLRLFFFVTIVMVIIANAYYHKYEQQILEEKVVVTSNSTTTQTEESKKETERMKSKILTGVRKTFGEISVYLKYISFLLLPVYALGFKLLYRRSKRFYIDHLAYTLHIQSFAYIIASLLLLGAIFISPSIRKWWPLALIGVTVTYILISLRHLYKQSWIKTIVKSVLAMGYMFFITIMFISLMMIVNVFVLK